MNEASRRPRETRSQREARSRYRRGDEGESPKIIKIDVEGYETNVLKGAKSVLNNKNLEVIILELNNSGEKFGFNDDDIHKSLVDNNFLPCTYDPFKREVIQLETYTSHNTIYMRNNMLDKIKLIVKNSGKFHCNGLYI